MAWKNRKTRRHLDLTRVARCPSMKTGWATYEQALATADLMMLEGKVNPGCHITPYRCDECGEFHVYNRVIVSVGRQRKS